MKRSHDITACASACWIGALGGGLQAPEFYDTSDPRSQLIAREEGESTGPDRSAVAGLLMSHLFAGGPHPAHVLQKLYKLAQDVDRGLLAGLDMTERRMLTLDGEEAHAWRIVALLRGTRIRRRRALAHEAVIRGVLSEAWEKQRTLLMEGEVSAAALTDYCAANPGELLSDFEARRAVVLALLRFFFLTGPQPERTVKRVFMVAKAWFEPLILRMTLEQLARMFGQVRATWSWRGKKKLNGFLAARGAEAVKSPYQKSDAVCAKYAAAARGNRNRASGRRVA